MDTTLLSPSHGCLEDAEDCLLQRCGCVRVVGQAIMAELSPPRQQLRSLLTWERQVWQQADFVHLKSAKPNAALSCWREKVAQWCYDVVDHLHLDRSVVYFAMNLLDRYTAQLQHELEPPIRTLSKNLSSAPNKLAVSERQYEIASMAALFLAIRIAGSSSDDVTAQGNTIMFTMRQILSMSRGAVTLKDLVATGTSMIRSLSWDSQLMAPANFCSAWLQFIEPQDRQEMVEPSREYNSESLRTALDAACYLVEIAVCDAALSHCRPSLVALAAVSNTLKSVESSETPGDVYSTWLEGVQDTMGVDPRKSAMFSTLCDRLDALYNQSLDHRRQPYDDDEATDGPHLVSDEEDSPPTLAQQQALYQSVEAVSYASGTVIRSISQDEIADTETESLPNPSPAGNSNLSAKIVGGQSPKHPCPIIDDFDSLNGKRLKRTDPE